MRAIVEYFYNKRPDLGEKLLPEQVEMLSDLVDISIKSQAESCGRGFGKTMLSAGVALYFADDYSKKIGRAITVLLISAQRQIYDRIDEFFYYDKSLKPRLRQQPSGQSGYEIPREKFQFADTMSIVYDCLPTIKQIEGIRADVIIFDEAQDIPQAIYDKAIGCLKKDIIGKIIVIGTPYDEKGKGVNWFIDIVSNPRKYKYTLSQYSSEGCTWNDVDRWRDTWSTARFRAECQGVPPTREEMGVFPPVQIDKCVHGDANREGGPTSTLEVGLDWGKITVYFMTEKIGTIKRKVLFIKIWDNMAIDIVTQEIAGLLNTHNPSLIKADAKPTEYVGKVERYCHKKINYIDMAIREEQEGKMLTIKEHAIGQVQKKVREANLIVPVEFTIYPDLVTQLKKYKRRMSKGDDLVDGLILSCYDSPLIKPTSGKVIFPKNVQKSPYLNIPIGRVISP